MPLPKLVVFDLDECLWHPEMYTLDEIPNKDAALRNADSLVVGVKSSGQTISLYPGALQALQKIHAGEYPGMRCAAASSADTPLAVSIGRAALSILEVVPGVTVRDVFAIGFPKGFEGNLQIGRSGLLSSRKEDTHFPLLKSLCNIDYSGMLFFDDCNWGDHCTNVSQKCKGVISVKTPRGLQVDEWNKGLQLYNDSNR